MFAWLRRITRTPRGLDLAIDWLRNRKREKRSRENDRRLIEAVPDAGEILDEAAAAVTLPDMPAEQLLALQDFRSLVASARSGEPIGWVDTPARLERLVEAMQQHGMTAEFPINHFFIGRLYVREILIPEGAFAIGELQREGHVNVIARGEISMLNDDGSFTRFCAPFTCIGSPGVRKCGFAHSDVVWTTVHDMSLFGVENPQSLPPKQLEDHLVCRTRAEYERLQLINQIGVPA